ncbi:B-cell receptor CD22-like [Mugil cephalus]|uniref:B-cell receptor CD22-like n=1 Tax=Mugil cephalus TaxID=48193 RepID=UPI001FB66D60|nr:B-cell receptor CD22-like [Mugil cephalus]
MRLSAAVTGFVVIFSSVSVVLGQTGDGVTYSSTQICAVKGSTVEISCSYTYPSSINGKVTVVEKAVWFTKMEGGEPVDLMTDAELLGRVQYHCDENKCTLRISDLRERDSAKYKFRFITNQEGGRFTGSPGVTLTVSVLRVEVKTSSGSSRVEVKCQSSSRLSARSYVWYKNGVNMNKDTYSIKQSFDWGDSVSCAVKGFEKFPSPPRCVLRQTCKKVTYTDRSICAIKGSSVNISSTYSHYYYYDAIVSKFWFRPDRSRQWMNPSQPEDLSKDSQYSGRVQVLEPETGRSTLRITNLTESDSSEYHFKFKTRRFEWRSVLPGTTLTVTVPHVQVKVFSSPSGLKLICHSSCFNPSHPQFVWFKNGKETWGTTFSYTGHISPTDSYSCAYEGYRSHSVYPPKLPSVSVSPSGEIVEGSSVTLTCNSDANPPANYTWYKENEDSPKASGQILNITDIRPEHRGSYYCEAHNRMGRRNSTLHLVVVASAWKTGAMATVTAALLVVPVLGVFLWKRRNECYKLQCKSGERPVNTSQTDMGPVYDTPSSAAETQPTEQQDDVHYSTINFSQGQIDVLYSNIRQDQPRRQTEEEDEDTEYTAVKCVGSGIPPGPRRQENVEDSFF